MTWSVLFVTIETKTFFLLGVRFLVCDPFKWRRGGFRYRSIFEMGQWPEETGSRGRFLLEDVAFLDESSDADGFG